VFVWAATALVTAAASAQTIVVDTLADAADPPFDSNPPCGSGTLAELPGADGKISLREAIVAANNTGGPQEIRLDASLRGGTVTVDFDSGDEGTEPEPLPILCGGDTTIDGDADDDETPDFALVAHPQFPPFTCTSPHSRWKRRSSATLWPTTASREGRPASSCRGATSPMQICRARCATPSSPATR
jgi:hypothetical protein